MLNRKFDAESDVDAESETTRLNLLPDEHLASFWDALRHGIRPFLCLIVVRLLL